MGRSPVSRGLRGLRPKKNRGLAPSRSLREVALFPYTPVAGSSVRIRFA